MSDYGSLETFPWPSDEDDLFGGRTSQWRNVAYVEGPWGSNPHAYARGYRDAAEALVDYAMKQVRHPDFLIYPIMFLYRQFVELRLKQIAIAAAQLLDESPPRENILQRHELEPIWSFCRRMLLKTGGGPVADLDNVERTVKQLAWADGGSYAFRYARDKRGDRSLPSELKGIDLANVRDVMAGVGNFLDSAVDMIDAEQDARDDWLSEVALYGP
jgi:hypothetical protein